MMTQKLVFQMIVQIYPGVDWTNLEHVASFDDFISNLEMTLLEKFNRRVCLKFISQNCHSHQFFDDVVYDY